MSAMTTAMSPSFYEESDLYGWTAAILDKLQALDNPHATLTTWTDAIGEGVENHRLSTDPNLWPDDDPVPALLAKWRRQLDADQPISLWPTDDLEHDEWWAA